MPNPAPVVDVYLDFDGTIAPIGTHAGPAPATWGDWQFFTVDNHGHMPALSATPHARTAVSLSTQETHRMSRRMLDGIAGWIQPGVKLWLLSDRGSMALNAIAVAHPVLAQHLEPIEHYVNGRTRGLTPDEKILFLSERRRPYIYADDALCALKDELLLSHARQDHKPPKMLLLTPDRRSGLESNHIAQGNRLLTDLGVRLPLNTRML